MPKGGSKPGEHRGGRKKGGTNKATRERQMLAEREMGISDRKLPKEMLLDLATVAVGMLASYQPAGRAPDGDHRWRKPEHERKYLEWMKIAWPIVAEAADYYSPKLRAVVLAPPPPDRPGDDATVIDLKIFENTGTALELLDDIKEK